jgi:O-antigen ligase
VITYYLERFDFKKIYSLLIYAFIFCLPLQINVILYSPKVFLGGGFNTYSHFLLYFGDILLILSFLFVSFDFFLRRFKYKENKTQIFPLITLFLIFCLLSYFFSTDKNLAFFTFLRFLLFYYLYYFLSMEIVSLEKIKKIFVISILIQAIIAIFQFIFQSSIGLIFFGEPAISAASSGIAKIDFNGMKFIRAYGTFPHPNILSAFILTGIFFVLQFLEKSGKKILLYSTLLILIIALLLTFSRMAIFGLIIMSIFYFKYSNILRDKIKKFFFTGLIILIILGLAFPLINLFIKRFQDFESIAERIQLMEISGKMFFAHPFGVGLSNFTLEMNNFTDLKIFPWEYQPVHNVFMLIFNEIGFFGGFLFLIIFLIIFKNTERKNLGFLFAILIFMLFDHFYFSQYQGQALFFLTFSLQNLKDKSQ